MPIITNIRTIKINDIEFTPIGEVDYFSNYVAMHEDVEQGFYPELAVWRNAILTDLWFIVYFILGEGKNSSRANHPFLVNACREIQKGPADSTLDLWAREHFKSSCITVAETIQYALRTPNNSTCIFSYARPVAKKFLFEIKSIFENSNMIKACFPDVVWDNPYSEAPIWSLDDGLVLKRSGSNRMPTVMAAGLVEGMPTGMHFDRMIFDDIVTEDIATSVDVMETVKLKFDSAQNLGTDGGTHRVVGTFYHHNDPLVYVRDKKDEEGKAAYVMRLKPATADGKANSKPVFLSEGRFKKLQNTRTFNCQQLLNPTPDGSRKFSREMLNEIHPDDIPKNIPSFLLVDWAGDENGKDSDSWAIGVVGVDPNTEDLRTSKIYITDLALSPMKEPQAVDLIVKMYLRNYIEALAVEKINSGILGLHVAGILNDKHRRRVTEADKTLIYLKPAGRDKHQRISTALEIPFLNGNVHISTNVDPAYRDRLRQEMDNFPMWHEDGLDMLSYIYDILADQFWQSRLRVYQKPKETNPFGRRGHLSLVGGGYNKTWMAA